ncbi:MAG: winged helix-turn-helix domain-containing protein [Pseudomonadota bacterium]
MSTDSDFAQPRFQIDDLHIDTATRTVLRDEKPLKIGGLTFDFLCVLIDRAPAVASYEELADHVWQGRPVTPETIAQRAKLLRTALGDDAAQPRYFELCRGHGYRLVPAVTAVPESGLSTQRPQRWLLAVAALAALAVLTVLFRQEAPPPSVAVLPFVDLSADGDQAYFGDGIAEQLIDELTRLEDVMVAGRTLSFAYRDAELDPTEIADELGVTTILEGSIRRSGDKLRITAQLVDADTGYHLWSGTFDRPMADVLAVQDDIATAVAGALGVRLGVGDVNAFLGAGTTNIDAYEYYLRAVRGPPGEPRMTLLRKALEQDPDYGAALAALGFQYFGSQWRYPVEEAPGLRERGWPLLQRAVELDPDSAYAIMLLGVTSYCYFEWSESERHFRRALEMEPDPHTYDHHANMIMRTGRSRDALSLYDLAMQDSSFPVIMPGALRANALLALKRYEELEGLIADDKIDHRVNTRTLRYLLAVNRGNLDELKEWFPASTPPRDNVPRRFLAVRESFDDPDRALALLRELREDETGDWPSKYHDIALLAAFFGDPEFALEVFSTEVRLTPIRNGALWYPVFAEVRRLPEFEALMREIGLVEYWNEFGWTDHCRPSAGGEFHCF